MDEVTNIKCAAWPCFKDKKRLGWFGDTTRKRTQRGHRGGRRSRNLLTDPFSSWLTPRKLEDGEVPLSAPVQFTTSGQITCDTGADTYIALVPGLSAAVCWAATNSTTPTTTAVASDKVYNPHINTSENRNALSSTRLVSTGLRLSVDNPEGQQDGTWQAARVPFVISEFSVGDELQPRFIDRLHTDEDLSSYPSYATGNISDLDLYQFKLNSVSNSHPFSDVVDPHNNTVAYGLDSAFDVIIIRVTGRTDPGTPTVLNYTNRSNQEVVEAPPTLSVISTGANLSNGNPDPNWNITVSPAGGTLPRAATVFSEFGAANDAESGWIKDGTETGVGEYVIETTFDLTGFDPATASLSFGYLVENRLVSVLLNGNDTGVSSTGTLLFTYQNETLNNPAHFVAGVNTLAFRWAKDGAAGGNGVRVKVNSVSADLALPTDNGNMTPNTLSVNYQGVLDQSSVDSSVQPITP